VNSNQFPVCVFPFFGIAESTLYGKQNEYKEFMDAIKKGRAEGLHQVSNALFEKATQDNVRL